MRKIIYINFIKVFLLFLFAKPVYASVPPMSEQSAQITQVHLAQKLVDERVHKLEEYLATHNSPLTPYAKVFIDHADKYGLFDWKLVPAITGVESTFGKAIPTNSYNAYGWGNGSVVFTSWEQSIDLVSQALKEKYIDRGLDTVEKIAPVYAPPSHTWVYKINKFMVEIANFGPKKSEQLDLSL